MHVIIICEIKLNFKYFVIARVKLFEKNLSLNVKCCLPRYTQLQMSQRLDSFDT